jgi:hypothetical protein
LLRDEVRYRTGALDVSPTSRTWAPRHPHQTTARKILKRSLGVQAAEASDRPPPPGNDHLASPLHSLQILTEAIVQLSNSDFAPRLM